MFRYLCMMALAMTTVVAMSSFTSHDEDELDLEAILREAVAEVNAECPQDLGEGMVLNKAYIANRRMVYQFTAPTEVVEGFDMMKGLDPQATNQLMMEAMLSGGDEVIFLFLLCAEADYGIEFKFASKGNSASTSLILSSDDLGSILEEKYTEEDLEEIVGNLIMSYM